MGSFPIEVKTLRLSFIAAGDLLKAKLLANFQFFSDRNCAAQWT